MYYDKQFQLEPQYPLLALHHEQIKQCTTAGFLTASKQNFAKTTECLANLDPDVLQTLATRLKNGENVTPQTDAEKMCFAVIHDVDIIAQRIPGSNTSKQHSRNEIWSIIAHRGAPNWFITFTPGDISHPISLYFASTKEKF
ncbi:hypothetical protein JAAARDRAFT_110705, partial [Jaapia argillacea MUCL 33604]